MADPVTTPLDAPLLVNRTVVEVNTGTNAEPVWTVVRGISEFKENIEKNLADVSDFDGRGYKSQAATSIGWSVEIKAHLKTDTDGELDSGIQFVLGKERAIGSAANADVRWFDLDDRRKEAKSGRAVVVVTREGGSVDDVDSVSVTFEGSGPLAEINHPYPLPVDPEDPEPEE